MGLKDQLTGVIPDSELHLLSDRFEVIGDIAILSLPADFDSYHPAIAAAVMRQHHNIRTVLNKTSLLTGNDRTARYEVLAGDDTITTHREYGFSYELDVRHVFFNSGLSTERDRVTRQVREGEEVLVPFCGVGPFVIPAAARGARVLAVEQNPEACNWLTRNIRLNHVDRNVTVVNADASDRSLFSHRMFDRAIIPTPYGMDSILKTIAPSVKPGGMIHFYTFKKNHQIPGLAGEYRQRGFEPVYFRACGSVAPCVSRWVFDLEKTGI